MPPYDRPELSAQVGFAANPLLRHSERRDDAAEIARRRQAADARTLVIAGDLPILKRDGEDVTARWPLDEAAALGEARETPFLGTVDGAPLFAALLDADAAGPLKDRAGVLVVDLRSIAVQGLIPPAELGPLGEAKALTYWHRGHRFCSNCGAPSRMASGGWRRECDACGTHHFPRTDPVVIMLAVRGDRCLLGRQPRFVPGMYSALAGFIEPGETIEDAVRRETHEEAGIRGGRVDYMCSQPWPFPASLMIGCIIEALDEDLVVDRAELEDARWFAREEVRLMLAGRHPGRLFCPPPMAIAHHLVKAFATDSVDR